MPRLGLLSLWMVCDETTGDVTHTFSSRLSKSITLQCREWQRNKREADDRMMLWALREKGSPTWPAKHKHVWETGTLMKLCQHEDGNLQLTVLKERRFRRSIFLISLRCPLIMITLFLSNPSVRNTTWTTLTLSLTQPSANTTKHNA